MRVIAIFAILALVSGKELTPSNFDEATAGKSVFIKFLAPWCGHCKSMKPAWDKLMDEYDGHASALVADVDCTAAGKPLCDSNGVKGFPTIKYGDPTNLEDYKGGRDFDSLKKFAEENLKPSCGPANIDLCDDAKKAEIEGYQKMSTADLKKSIEEDEDKISEAEKVFKTELEKLQAKYKELMAEKEAVEKAVKEAGLGIKKAVLANAKKDANDEL